MNTILTKLTQLTVGLLYIGESEFPFEIFDYDVANDDAIKSNIQKNYGSAGDITSLKTKDFFDNYINRLFTSGDEIMMADISKYKALQSFIDANFNSSTVYRYGTIKVGIYIVCKTKTGQVFVLKTYTIET